MFDAIIIEIQETWKDAYKKFEVSRSNLKFNKRGGPNKVRGGGKKIAKLISGGDVYLAPKSTMSLHGANLSLIGWLDLDFH